MTSGHPKGEAFPPDLQAVDPDVATGRPQDPLSDAAAARPDPVVEEQAPQPGPEDSPEMTDELAKAQTALTELTTDLQRLQAEYLNYKRRVERDRELVRQNATFAALAALLPVLDDIDRAREHGEVEGGFKAVADALERTVAGMGLVKFGVPGDVFDPNLHEALMHAHSPEVTTTTCQQIIHSGYRIGDRVVRPARVIVVDPEPEPVVEESPVVEERPAESPVVEERPEGASRNHHPQEEANDQR